MLLNHLGVPQLPVKWFKNPKTVGRVLRLSLRRAATAVEVLVELVGAEAAKQLATELDILEAEPGVLKDAYTFM